MRFLTDDRALAKAPPVSVVIPTYNRFQLLADAISSAYFQTYRDFELIVVDDGSIDETRGIPADGIEIRYPEVLRHLAPPGETEPMVPMSPPTGGFRYKRITHTGMPGAVRNAGVALSRAPHIAFLDSDDVWRPEKLAMQADIMKAGCKLSHTRELWRRSGRTISQSSQRHQREGDLFKESLRKCIIGPSTAMIDRDFMVQCGGFREDIEIAEDYELWLRLVPNCRVEYIDLALTVKRAGHGDQLTEKYGHIEIFRLRALKQLVDEGFFYGADLQLARIELSRKCAIYANGARRRGRVDDAAVFEEYADFYGNTIAGQL